MIKEKSEFLSKNDDKLRYELLTQFPLYRQLSFHLKKEYLLNLTD